MVLHQAVAVNAEHRSRRDPPRREDYSKLEIKTTDLGHGVYLLNWQGGDSIFLVGDDGVLLVDTSVAQMGAKIGAAIARVSRKPITLVINTHWRAHGQRHIGALQTGQRHPRQRHHRGKRGLSVLRHVFGRLARRDDRR